MEKFLEGGKRKANDNQSNGSADKTGLRQESMMKITDFGFHMCPCGWRKTPSVCYLT
jgi:hypothetical protein